MPLSSYMTDIVVSLFPVISIALLLVLPLIIGLLIDISSRRHWVGSIVLVLCAAIIFIFMNLMIFDPGASLQCADLGKPYFKITFMIVMTFLTGLLMSYFRGFPR